jgi:hypothetical protein
MYKYAFENDKIYNCLIIFVPHLTWKLKIYQLEKY